MGIFGAAIKGFGKALSKGKKTKKVDKVQKSASAFVKRRKQLSGAAGGPKPKKTVGISKEMKDALKFGTIAAVGLGASKTIKKNKPVKKAMGGEAGESLRKGTLFKEKRDKRRKEVDEMIERLYGPGIKPKKKPKNLDKIRPKTKPKKTTKVKTPKIVKDLRAAGGIKSSDAIKAAIEAMKSKK